MTCFRLGANGILSTAPTYTSAARYQPQPLVEFSPSSQDRATLMPSAGASPSAGQRRRRRRRQKVKRSSLKTGGNRRKRTRTSKIRIIRGRVALRLSGRPGVQHIGAGQLVRFVPINKLRQAARRVLGPVGHRRRRRQGGRVKKQQQRRHRRRPSRQRRRH